MALNKERATEEARGLMRWLRPDYQIPRFGSQTEKAALEEQLGMLGTEATAPLDAATVAMTFKQGRRIAPKVAAVLAALTRIGRIAITEGKTFALKQAA